MYGLTILGHLCLVLFIVTGCNQANQNQGGVSSKQSESVADMRSPDEATMSAFTYEPTNGTTSNSGVYRIK